MNYPSNSHRDKDVNKAEKDITPLVTEGEYIFRKKSSVSKFFGSFFKVNAKSVMTGVVYDIFGPALRDMLAEMGIGIVERSLYGEERSSKNRTASNRYAGRTSYNYNSISANRSSASATSARDARDFSSRSARNFDDVVLQTRGQAEEILDMMFMFIERYNQVTVSDMYDMLGASKGPYIDNRWGWTDLRGSRVTRTRDGYLLDLPEPESLR